MPVVYTGTNYQFLRDALDRERQWSGTLAEQVCRLAAERRALREQLVLADELCGAARSEMEILRAEMERHGLHPERLLED